MSLVYAAIIPHTPELFVKKDGCLPEHEATHKNIGGELYASKPDILVTISPHLGNTPEAFIFQVAEKYIADHSAVGDFSHAVEFSGSLPLLYRVKEALETHYTISLVQEERLDYGTALPLFSIYDKMPNRPALLPIGSSLAPLSVQMDFGRSLAELFQKETKRIACLVSANLSHRHTVSSPGGFSEQAKNFDAMITELIQKQKIEEVVRLDEEALEEVGECGIRPLSILAGLVGHKGFNCQVLHYGVTNGVGHLLASFTPT